MCSLGKVVPKHGLLEGIYDTIGMVPAEKFRKAFKSKRLQAVSGEVAKFDGNKLILADGSEIEVKNTKFKH